MKRLLFPLALSLLISVAVFGALGAASPAAAQSCSADYELFLSFESSLPGELTDDDGARWPRYYDWSWYSVSVDGSGGSMQAVTTQETQTGLTSGEILSLLGIGPDYVITANVTITAAMQRPSNGGTMYIFTHYSDGGQSGISHSTGYEWITATHTGEVGRILDAIEFQFTPNDGSNQAARFDNVRIRIPCESVAYNEPEATVTPTNTPTPSPTPTPTPTPSSPLWDFWYTSTVTGSWPAGTGPGGPPMPFEIPEPDPDHTLDVSPLWDVGSLYDSLRAFLTVWVLADRYRAVSIAVVFGALILAVIWMIRLVGGRESNV